MIHRSSPSREGPPILSSPTSPSSTLEPPEFQFVEPKPSENGRASDNEKLDDLRCIPQ
jgi:hypothetical protein